MRRIEVHISILESLKMLHKMEVEWGGSCWLCNVRLCNRLRRPRLPTGGGGDPEDPPEHRSRSLEGSPESASSSDFSQHVEMFSASRWVNEIISRLCASESLECVGILIESLMSLQTGTGSHSLSRCSSAAIHV